MAVTSLGPGYQKPGATLRWHAWLPFQEHLHLLGVGETAINVKYTYDIDGVERWYEQDPTNGSYWQNFAISITKEGGGLDDFFKLDINAF